MAIQPLDNSGLQTISQPEQLNQPNLTDRFKTATGDQAVNKSQDPKEPQILTKEQHKIATQASIVQQLFGDKNSGDKNSSIILYQETITKLNELLAPDFGEDAISLKKLEEQGGMEYWSPENTAQRILDGSLAFFGAFSKQHSSLEGEELIDKFLDVIGGGLEKGFEEAFDILKGFEVFDGDIKSNAEKTHELVKQGLADFRKEQLELLKPAETPEKEAEEAALQ